MTAHQTRKQDGFGVAEGMPRASAGSSRSCQVGKPIALNGVNPPPPGYPMPERLRGGIPWHSCPPWPGLGVLCFLNSVWRLLPKLLQTNLLCQITCLAGLLSRCLSPPPPAVSTVYRQGNRNPMLRNFLLLLFSFKSASVPDSLSLETT